MTISIDSLKKNLLLVLLCIAVSGCAATPFYGRPMTNRIANDVSAFNKAYAESANAQILLNVLYSRDRLPRQYVGFKEISTTQNRTVSMSPSIKDIPLGNPATVDRAAPLEVQDAGKLWGMGEFGLSGAASSEPQYGVSPIVSEDLTKGALNPVSTDIFEHYWKNGWPKDVLLAVLAENLIKVEYADCPPTDEKKDKSASPQPDSLLSLSQKRIMASDSLSETAYYTSISKKETSSESDKPEDPKGCDNLISSAKYYNNSAETSLKKGDTDFLAVARWMHTLGGQVGLISIDTYDYKPKETIIQIQQTTTGAYTPTELQHLSVAFKKMKEVGFSPSFTNAASALKLKKANEVYIRINIKSYGKKPGPNNSKETKPLSCPVLPEREEEKANTQVTDKTWCFGDWLVELRSFDQAVYYLGELLRRPKADTKAPTFEQPWADPWSGSRVLMSAADCGKENQKAPLFRVLRNDKPLPSVDRWYPDVKAGYDDQTKKVAQFETGANDIWSARVRYRGSWYFTGPASPLNAGCSIPLDRSSTVLTLLGQIFEMNRSAESVRLPARFNN